MVSVFLDPDLQEVHILHLKPFKSRVLFELSPVF